jgi:hypothetical protein
MRRNRYFVAAGKFFIGMAFVVLIGSIVIAYQNNFAPIPWDPIWLIGVGFSLFIGLIIFGSAMVWYDTSWATRLHRDQQPYTPDRDTVVRVVVSDVSKKEYFVYGKLDETVREAVDNDWPFKGKLRDKEWYVIDAAENNVSDKLYSEVEGTLKVVFVPKH